MCDYYDWLLCLKMFEKREVKSFLIMIFFLPSIGKNQELKFVESLFWSNNVWISKSKNWLEFDPFNLTLQVPIQKCRKKFFLWVLWNIQQLF